LRFVPFYFHITPCLSARYTSTHHLPDPDILANEIIENIESGLNAFREIMETINGEE